ncbi:MAG TPA: hypothetical protein VN258_06440 [Mobilitalea sp.]|nr:hypothetical protein [Mobilitalea sp.]
MKRKVLLMVKWMFTRKALVLTAFTFFCLSILAMFGVAGAVECDTTTIHTAIIKLSIIVPILIINVILVNKFYVDGEWRV